MSKESNHGEHENTPRSIKKKPRENSLRVSNKGPGSVVWLVLVTVVLSNGEGGGWKANKKSTAGRWAATAGVGELIRLVLARYSEGGTWGAKKNRVGGLFCVDGGAGAGFRRRVGVGVRIRHATAREGWLKKPRWRFVWRRRRGWGWFSPKGRGRGVVSARYGEQGVVVAEKPRWRGGRGGFRQREGVGGVVSARYDEGGMLAAKKNRSGAKTALAAGLASTVGPGVFSSKAGVGVGVFGAAAEVPVRKYRVGGSSLVVFVDEGDRGSVVGAAVLSEAREGAGALNNARMPLAKDRVRREPKKKRKKAASAARDPVVKGGLTGNKNRVGGGAGGGEGGKGREARGRRAGDEWGEGRKKVGKEAPPGMHGPCARLRFRSRSVPPRQKPIGSGQPGLDVAGPDGSDREAGSGRSRSRRFRSLDPGLDSTGSGGSRPAGHKEPVGFGGHGLVGHLGRESK
ncbi:hypothetical protein BDN72DRAFT_865524 [Pluteus cervinus]|uniref:Uncharacterized protein n=1 Tax=Pluteus cervinus TaxID=181527 RepID=A0ACD2ZZU3_9AGAR|nr:hypothetical protein BDN72DRAFT_865524 [Pluteus cervinus]